MADNEHCIREIRWSELFPWLGLVRAVRLAFAPRMLILAALGLAATSAGWRIIGDVFSGTDQQPLKELIDEGVFSMARESFALSSSRSKRERAGPSDQ